MTATRSNYNELGIQLAQALGLKQVTKLVLTFQVGAPPTVEATMNVMDAAGELVDLVKRFDLNPAPVLESQGAAPEPRPAR